MAGILVHEWLAPTGGSENVFEVLSDIFPDAERWCLWNSSEGRFTDVNETWLARTPLRGRKAMAVPFMPLSWRSLPSRDAEWVLASSHAFAHHARFGGAASGAPKLVYAHTPARYVWVPDADARGAGPLARAASAVLKPLDKRRAREPWEIAANSRYVAQRIADTWEREARVIYPPVDVKRFSEVPTLSAVDASILSSLSEDFVLGASRFVTYKRLEEAIHVGNLAGLPVVLAGGGPDEERLRRIASEARVPVTFILEPSHELLSALYRRARLFIFAPVEDFGIMPVEAMAAGTPAIVNSQGGGSESVLDGRTGAHVVDWSDDAELSSAIERAMNSSSSECSTRAAEFDVEVFRRSMLSWVSSVELAR